MEGEVREGTVKGRQEKYVLVSYERTKRNHGNKEWFKKLNYPPKFVICIRHGQELWYRNYECTDMLEKS